MKAIQQHRKQAQQQPREPPLRHLNETLEGQGGIPKDLWVQWLWESNPEEPVGQTLLLNRCHLLGLMVCRHQATQRHKGGEVKAKSKAEEDSRMTLMEKSPHDMTLRELKDTVDNVLIEWPQFLHRLQDNPSAQANLKTVLALIDDCFARLGWLAMNPCNLTTMDDPTCVQEHAPEQARLNLTFLRRMLGSFMVLFRHLFILSRSSEVDPEPYDCGIKKHHLEASNDNFHILCMHMKLPVAARLNYKHDFPGMYNHVSQAMYFHNPNYQRMLRVTVDDVPEGEPVQVLPAVQLLYPEIKMVLEEDAVDLSRPTPGKWLWVVLPGRVYLADPEGKFYHSTNINALVKLYTERKETTA